MTGTHKIKYFDMCLCVVKKYLVSWSVVSNFKIINVINWIIGFSVDFME